MLKDPKWDKKEKKLKASPKNVYAKAADAIEEHGHCKHFLIKRGAMCLQGAINFTMNGDATKFSTATQRKVQALAPLIIKDHPKAKHFNPIAWNNAKATTKKHVIALLRKAALVL